jgi:hypothetical protein
LQYTSKGVASIFAGWGAAKLLEVTGSWLPVLWAAIGLDLLAATLAYFWLRPLAARTVARNHVEQSTAAPAVATGLSSASKVRGTSAGN